MNNNLKNKLNHLIQLSKHLNVENIAKVVIDNPKFLVWSASSHPERHHYGKHGLLIHTYEVVNLCLNNNNTGIYGLDDEELFLAALFHDYGKIWDYRPSDTELSKWSSTDHKYAINHISKSYAEFYLACIKENYCSIKMERIGHSILAHHGLNQWGSPVEPITKAAWLLHLCDGISARMYDCKG